MSTFIVLSFILSFLALDYLPVTHSPSCSVASSGAVCAIAIMSVWEQLKLNSKIKMPIAQTSEAVAYGMGPPELFQTQSGHEESDEGLGGLGVWGFVEKAKEQVSGRS